MMNHLPPYLNGWFDWVFACSWQLALLVIIVAGLTFLLRDASPKLRYGLWLLVLIKALLPPSLGFFWGIGSWGFAPLADNWLPETSSTSVPGNAQAAVVEGQVDGAIIESAIDLGGSPIPISLTVVVWAVGCLGLTLAALWRYRQIVKTTDQMQLVEEGPVRVELERLAQQFSVHSVPDLYTTSRKISPMLTGVFRPKIVLPQSVLDRLSSQELRLVLAHELVHWRRHDTLMGWLQMVVQCLFWFHPLVWYANGRIRHERECACDETVLRELDCDRDGYGETIVQVLTAARGKSLVVANMVGVFERGSLLQTRLEEIMCFDPEKRRFGWVSRFSIIAVALVLLPMSAPAVQPDLATDTASASDGESESDPQDQSENHTGRPKTNWPTIVATTPKLGATDVDPDLDEIRVTFDRDMNVSGYSWTGGGEFHPPSPDDAKPVWIDRRTCVLPVKLKKASFYRVGINSTSFQNFRSELGVPAPTSAIYFATAGAKRAVMGRVRVPRVLKMVPANGAKDVAPTTKKLIVKFDLPMSTEGYSWTGGGPTFPTIPQGESPSWSRDGKTCTLPVELKPGMQYELGLNSLNHKNFASKWGVPLEPVRYSFQTTGDPVSPPRIVSMVPENGATDVSPSLTQLQVTFDKTMAGGFSWTGGGDRFPTIPEGKKPSWSRDRKTCTLPVELQPSWNYQLGLNSKSFKNFASADGIALEPVVYQFQTSPGND